MNNNNDIKELLQKKCNEIYDQYLDFCKSESEIAYDLHPQEHQYIKVHIIAYAYWQLYHQPSVDTTELQEAYNALAEYYDIDTNQSITELAKEATSTENYYYFFPHCTHVQNDNSDYHFDDYDYDYDDDNNLANFDDFLNTLPDHPSKKNIDNKNNQVWNFDICKKHFQYLAPTATDTLQAADLKVDINKLYEDDNLNIPYLCIDLQGCEHLLNCSANMLINKTCVMRFSTNNILFNYTNTAWNPNNINYQNEQLIKDFSLKNATHLFTTSKNKPLTDKLSAEAGTKITLESFDDYFKMFPTLKYLRIFGSTNPQDKLAPQNSIAYVSQAHKTFMHNLDKDLKYQNKKNWWYESYFNEGHKISLNDNSNNTITVYQYMGMRFSLAKGLRLTWQAFVYFCSSFFRSSNDDEDKDKDDAAINSTHDYNAESHNKVPSTNNRPLLVTKQQGLTTQYKQFYNTMMPDNPQDDSSSSSLQGDPKPTCT